MPSFNSTSPLKYLKSPVSFKVIALVTTLSEVRSMLSAITFCAYNKCSSLPSVPIRPLCTINFILPFRDCLELKLPLIEVSKSITPLTESLRVDTISKIGAALTPLACIFELKCSSLRLNSIEPANLPLNSSEEIFFIIRLLFLKLKSVDKADK